MRCGVGRRRCSDPVLLWLWRELAATALIGLLAWESPYASGAALEKAKRQTTTTKNNNKKSRIGEKGQTYIKWLRRNYEATHKLVQNNRLRGVPSWLCHFSHSNFKDLVNVHDGGFVFPLLPLSTPFLSGRNPQLGDLGGTRGVCGSV